MKLYIRKLLIGATSQKKCFRSGKSSFRNQIVKNYSSKHYERPTGEQFKLHTTGSINVETWKMLIKNPLIVFIIFSFFVKHKKIYVTFPLLLIYCTGDKNSSKQEGLSQLRKFRVYIFSVLFHAILNGFACRYCSIMFFSPNKFPIFQINSFV